MPKLDLDIKKKGLTIGEAVKILKGTDKRKLTPKQQKEVKEVKLALKRTSDGLKTFADKALINFTPPSFNLPDTFTPVTPSFLNYEIEGKVEESKLRKLMIDYYESQIHQHNLQNPTFDESESSIQFGNKSILIRRDTNQFYICQVIFQNKRKIWNWDEIVEEWGDNKEMRNWRVIYNAGREINKRIAIETSVKDLLLVTKKTISFNPYYL